MGKIDVMSEIDIEIEEYQEMITHAIQTNNKADLAMWRRALQTAKISKGDLLTHNVVRRASCDNLNAEALGG